VALSVPDYDALCAAGEEKVAADLAQEFQRFLASPAGRVYPVVSGIPVMLVEDALSRDELES
jgi:uncharacterized protein YbaR (Trm112 family)